MRILGLDFGSKTVGVAVSDPLGITAQPVEILIEEKITVNGVEYQVGHTKEYIRAAIISEEDLTNQIIPAVIGDTIEERLCAAKPLNRI